MSEHFKWSFAKNESLNIDINLWHYLLTHLNKLSVRYNDESYSVHDWGLYKIFFSNKKLMHSDSLKNMFLIDFKEGIEADIFNLK